MNLSLLSVGSNAPPVFCGSCLLMPEPQQYLLSNMQAVNAVVVAPCMQLC